MEHLSSSQDLEEQSRLIAASSRSNQSAGEGQFVVLSSSQSEDSDLGEEGKKKRESEAWDDFTRETLNPCSEIKLCQSQKEDGWRVSFIRQDFIFWTV